MTPNTDCTLKTTAKDNSQHQLLAELTDVVRQQLGMKGPDAIVTAEALFRGLMNRVGGQEIYIPAPPRTERNAAILGDFKGNNAAEVCTKHDISRRTLYRILTNRVGA